MEQRSQQLLAIARRGGRRFPYAPKIGAEREQAAPVFCAPWQPRPRTAARQDLGAKILVRSLREYVDVLVLLIARPELAGEFEQEDFNKANEFWHRHVRSLKARRALWASLAPGMELPIDWTEFEKEEDTTLSLAAHPSYVAV